MRRAIGPGLLGLGITIASTFAPSLGLSVHAQKIGFGFGVALLFIGALLYAGDWRTRHVPSNATRPHLVFRGIEHANENWPERIVWHRPLAGLHGDAGTYEEMRHHPRLFARVQVANAPPNGVLGENANDVAAELTFEGPPGSAPLTIGGHWCLHARLDPDKAVWDPPIDLPANGQPQGLDIAMQDTGDGATYAFSDLNRKVGDAKLPEHELVHTEYRVTVKLRPSNYAHDTVQTFRLHTGGKGDPMRLGPEA